MEYEKYLINGIYLCFINSCFILISVLKIIFGKLVNSNNISNLYGINVLLQNLFFTERIVIPILIKVSLSFVISADNF